MPDSSGCSSVEQAVRGEVDDAILAEFRTHCFRPRRVEARRNQCLVRWNERDDRFRFVEATTAGAEGKPSRLMPEVSRSPAQVRGRRETFPLAVPFVTSNERRESSSSKDRIGQKGNSLGAGDARTVSRRSAASADAEGRFTIS